MGIIIKEAVANGRLTDRNNAEDVSPVKRYAHAHGTSSDVVAIAAALSKPWVDVVLSGAATIDQLTSNLHAIALSETADDWPDIAEPATQYWNHRRTLTWQ